MNEVCRRLVASITGICNVGIELGQSMISVVCPTYEFTWNQSVPGTDGGIVD